MMLGWSHKVGQARKDMAEVKIRKKPFLGGYKGRWGGGLSVTD